MSWIVVNRETGEAVVEVWNAETVQHVNLKKYFVVTALLWLQSLNFRIEYNCM